MTYLPLIISLISIAFTLYLYLSKIALEESRIKTDNMYEKAIRECYEPEHAVRILAQQARYSLVKEQYCAFLSVKTADGFWHDQSQAYDTMAEAIAELETKMQTTLLGMIPDEAAYNAATITVFEIGVPTKVTLPVTPISRVLPSKIINGEKVFYDQR